MFLLGRKFKKVFLNNLHQKKGGLEKKIKYLHQLVAVALKDLLPYFKEAETASWMISL